MKRNRLKITMESRIHGDVYVRFGGERLETYRPKGRQGALRLACDTERINLVLSENQKVMTKNRQGNEYFWTPTKEYYKGSVEYGIPSFLEYKFKSVSFKK